MFATMTTCLRHLYSGVLPCAWPGCEYGNARDELIVLGKRFVRRLFHGLAGAELYTWVASDRTAAFDIPRLVRRFVAQLHDVEVEGEDSFFYHYTSIFGLEAVLASGELWLSDYRSLNDTTELAIGRDAAHAVFEGFRGKSIAPLLQQALEVSVSEAFYVGSFSQVGDCLNQWRAYADSARGVSIGFEPLEFYRLIQLDPQAITLTNVAYARDIHQQLFELIATLTEQAMEFDAQRGVAEPVVAASEIGRLISEVLPMCKNPGFADERECRLVVVPCLTLSGHVRGLEPRTRRVGTRDVLFVTTAMLDRGFTLPIRKIVAGPLIADADGARVEALARQHGFGFDRSRIPLRRD
jgi:hypothetical protein